VDAPVGVRVGSTVPAAAKAEAAQQDAAKRAAQGTEGAAKRRGAPREGRAGQEEGGGGTSGSRMAEAAHAFFLLRGSGLRGAVGPCGRISPLHLCGLNCGDSRVGGAGLPSGLAAKPAPLAS